MSVHLFSFVDGLYYESVPKVMTLFGKPFPPDDVRAYWSLVPQPIIVEWTGHMFLVRRLVDSIIEAGRVLDGEEAQPVIRLQIMATDARKLDVWMDVIARLVNGAS